ncbi:histidine phosphatase family protein [Neobacillus mesonae]|nr:histidine phosphatase family protein [Neobacillus mesonae]
MSSCLDLYLVRHGRTRWNAERRYLGHTDIPLLSEAEYELERLKPQLDGITFQHVYVSDLIRSVETLRLIAPQLSDGAVKDERIREYHFGEWEGATYEMLQNNPAYRSWIDSPETETPPGAESFAAFTQRITGFVEDKLLPILLNEASVKHQSEVGQIESLSTQPTDKGNVTKASSGDPSHDIGIVPPIESNSSPRVLVVTHGGVIKQLVSAYIPNADFHSLMPGPGEMLVLRLMLQDGRLAARILHKYV